MIAHARLFLVALCAVGAVACRTPTPADSAGAQLVSPRHEAPQRNERRESLLGVIVAPQTVDVTSQLDGRLRAIAVRVGDRVTRGSLLARLDGRSARQDLTIARAELATAEAEREQAKLEVAQAAERAERRAAVVELPSQTVGTVSEEELSSSRYQKRIAEVKLATAEAAVLEKRAHLEQMRLLVMEGALRSPFDGVVVARYLDAGSAVHKATPVVRLLEAGDLRVRFAVPEERADSLGVGMPVRVGVGAETVSGVVEKIAPEIDAAARMVFAEASIASDDANRNRLRSGQVAHVTLNPPLTRATP